MSLPDRASNLLRWFLAWGELPNGRTRPFQLDANANVKSAEQSSPGYENGDDKVAMVVHKAIGSAFGAWTNARLAAAAKTHVAKNQAGRVGKAKATNINATTGFYLCLVDKATPPVNGDTIMESAFVRPRLTGDATPNDASLDLPIDGAYCVNGVALCASSTATTVTLIAGNDMISSAWVSP